MFFLFIGCFALATDLLADKTAFSLMEPSLPKSQKLDFIVGKSLFDKLWVSAPASTQSSDGLGPLYNARSCASCHPRNGRGKPPEPGDTAISMFMRIDIPAQNTHQQQLLDELKQANIPDPVYGLQMQHFSVQGHAAEYQLKVDYQEIPIMLSDGETVNLRKPVYRLENLGYGATHPQARFSPRVAPPMIGLGLLEAIPENIILAAADENDSNNDGISGRANRVLSRANKQMMLGRFGLKAGMPTVDEQSQAAFSSDIGISTPLFPAGHGECTDKQQHCVNAPNGNSPRYNNLEAPEKITDLVNLYTSNLAVPRQRNPEHPDIKAGEKLFKEIGCQSCHTPEYQVAVNGIDKIIKPYTDLLLHDMGDGLADNRPEGLANGKEWRTTPLWGIGLTKAVSGHTYLLHDGRARNILEAVLWHEGEAKQQRDAVIALNKKQRQQLLRFIESL